MPHIDPNLFQFFGHPWTAVTSQTQTRLFLDVGQNDHVRALPPAGGAAAESPQATQADIHHPAQTLDRERPAVFFNKPEPHGFWLAKNWVVGSTGHRNIFDLRMF